MGKLGAGGVSVDAYFGHETPSPHSMLLGSEFVGWDADTQTATMRFTVQDQMCTWRGGVQGGLVAGYLDDVMGYAYVASTDGREAPLNLDLSMSLIRLIPQGATVTGTGRVVKAGRRVLFLEAELHDDEGRLLARATSTAIPTPKPEPGGTAGISA